MLEKKFKSLLGNNIANDKNMNCQECEKSIWMYSELSLVERSYIDGHIESCSDCRKLKEEIQTVSQILKHATPLVPELKNAAALTNRIMDALPSRNSTWSERFSDVLDNAWLQNSLRLASMVLIVLFVWESKPDSNRLTRIFPRGETVILNSMAFIKKYEELRHTPKGVTFYQRYQKVKKSNI